MMDPQSQGNTALSAQEQNKLYLLKTSLPVFAEHALKIETKDGNVIPFIFNRAQKYIHEKLEEQRAKIGRVRALILKGRQQGCSTYVAARFYHKASLNNNKKVFILSHEASSTDSLFDKVSFYYNNTLEHIKPQLLTDNQKTAKYGNGSEYSVATAGTEDTGRSKTAQFFHGSEIAAYKKHAGFRAGALQIVSKVAGTEVILETTAKGKANWVYQFYLDAVAGKNGFIVIFTPWFWQDEYRLPVPDDFVPTEEELTLLELYKEQGLTDYEQLQWRRITSAELPSDMSFKQEYPNNINEAFQASSASFYDADDIQRARKSTVEPYEGPLVFGVDPSLSGPDRTVISKRQVNVFHDPKIIEGKMDQDTLATIIAEMIEEEHPARVFIDMEKGDEVVAKLHRMGYKHIVVGVYFQNRPSNVRFMNKRAEIYFRLKDWFREFHHVRLPDSDDIEADLLAIPPHKHQTSSNKVMFPPKEEIKEAFGRSPDIHDSMVLTFSQPVGDDSQYFKPRNAAPPDRRNSSLQTQRRRYGGSVEWGDEQPKFVPKRRTSRGVSSRGRPDMILRAA